MTLLEQELNRHYQSTREAIRSGSLNTAMGRLDAYIRFAKTFLQTVSSRGVQFTEDASSYPSYHDWPTSARIIRDTQNAIDDAIKSENATLISHAAHLPIRFLELSLAHRDFLFYLGMLRAYPRILSLAYESAPRSNSNQILQSSHEPLRQFCDDQLLQLTSSHETRPRSRYVARALWTYYDLLRVAIDNDDPDTFEVLGQEFRGLFGGSISGQTSDSLPGELRDVVVRHSRVIWFDLGTWVIHRRSLAGSSVQTDPSLIPRFLEVISHNYATLRDLSEIYIEALSPEDDVVVIRDGAESTVPHQVVVARDIERLRTQYYCLEGLRMATGGARGILTPHYLLQFSLDDIESFVREVERDSHAWTDFFPRLATTPLSAPLSREGDSFLAEAVELFLRANRSAVEAAQRSREDEIIKAALDNAKRDQFKEECISGWHTQNWLEQFLEQRGQVSEASGHLDPIRERRIFRFLAQKDIFMTDQDAESPGLGQSYGSELADFLSRDLISEVESRCLEAPAVESHEVLAEITSRVRSLDNALVIVLGSRGVERQFLEPQDLIPYRAEPAKEIGGSAYLGRLGTTPVFHQYDDVSDKVLVVDVPKLGPLLHRVPPEHNYRGLRILIECLDREEAKELLSRDPYILPDLLKNQEGKPHDLEEAIRWVRLRVRVFVGATLEWENLGSDVGFIVPVAEPD